MEWLPLIIQLISGAAGGNIVGKLAKNIDLGTLGNSIAGLLGGGVGSIVLRQLGLPGGALEAGATPDIAAIISSVLSGGAGGGVLMTIIGLIKNALANKPTGN